MPDFSMSNLAVAFSITLAAGLFTVLGSGLVMFSKNAQSARVVVWFGICRRCDGICFSDGNFQ